MFDIGLPELMVLAIAALFIFGPNRLPEMAAKAARGLRQLRQMATNARQDLAKELGPEFENFDPSDLNPRNAIKKYVLDGIDEDDLRIDKDLDLRDDLKKLDEPDQLNGSSHADTPGAATASSTTQPTSSEDAADVAEANGSGSVTTKTRELPPFDPDAT